jgi:hypothetical protein
VRVLKGLFDFGFSCMSFAWFSVVQAHRGAMLSCSEGSVWGCSEKVPTATGQSWKNDRVEGAIGGKSSQKYVKNRRRGLGV